MASARSDDSAGLRDVRSAYPPEGFTRLIARNIIPVTQAIHHDNRHIHDPPYRIVALPGGL
ncbi:MAG: hypothetical protein JKP90_09825 [Desulfofustis sp. PB-SRB1]|nr:hypothetical protein [Desulfofustis sp. PB-SRB1]